MKPRIAFGTLCLVILVFLVGRPFTTTSAQSSVDVPSELHHSSADAFLGHTAAPLPTNHSWREVLELKPSTVSRVRCQIEETGTSVDAQLMLASNNDLDVIILGPEQPRETESNRRFEIAIVGKARMAVARLGMSSHDFRDKWIEVTGFPRHYTESWTHGNVAVSQFVVSDLDSIEVHDSNWQGSAFE